jgi:anion-transporting  ArsA/GET3 family ATPase
LIAGLAKFTGAEFLAQVAEFVTGINDLFGGFKERADEVSHALRSPEVAFVVVTSPSSMSIREAMYFSDRLRDAGMERDGVVVNGVHTLLVEPKEGDATLASLLAPLAPELDAEKTIARMWEALETERLRAVADRVETNRLRAMIGEDTPFVEVPAFERDVHDLAALARVAKHLVGAESVSA